jgi:hypothetical protein
MKHDTTESTEVEVKIRPFLISALDRDELSASRLLLYS